MFHRPGKKRVPPKISLPFDFEKKEIDFLQDQKAQLQRDASVPLPTVQTQRLPRLSSLPRSASVVDVRSRYYEHVEDPPSTASNSDTGTHRVPPRTASTLEIIGPGPSGDHGRSGLTSITSAEGHQLTALPLRSSAWEPSEPSIHSSNSGDSNRTIRRFTKFKETLADKIATVSNARGRGNQSKLPAIHEMSLYQSRAYEGSGDVSETDSIEARVKNDPDGEDLMKTSARMQNLENFTEESEDVERTAQSNVHGMAVIEASPKLQKFFGTKENDNPWKSTVSFDDRKGPLLQTGSPKAKLTKPKPGNEQQAHTSKSKGLGGSMLQGLGISASRVPEEPTFHNLDHYYKRREPGQAFDNTKSPFVQHSNVMEFAEPPPGFSVSIPPLNDSTSSHASFTDAETEIRNSNELQESPPDSTPSSPGKREGMAIARAPLKRLNTTDFEFVPERFRYISDPHSTPDSEKETPRASTVPTNICSHCGGTGVEPVNTHLVSMHKPRNDSDNEEEHPDVEYYDMDMIGVAF